MIVLIKRYTKINLATLYSFIRLFFMFEIDHIRCEIRFSAMMKKMFDTTTKMHTLNN